MTYNNYGPIYSMLNNKSCENNNDCPSGNVCCQYDWDGLYYCIPSPPPYRGVCRYFYGDGPDEQCNYNDVEMTWGPGGQYQTMQEAANVCDGLASTTTNGNPGYCFAALGSYLAGYNCNL